MDGDSRQPGQIDGAVGPRLIMVKGSASNCLGGSTGPTIFGWLGNADQKARHKTDVQAAIGYTRRALSIAKTDSCSAHLIF